MSIEENKLKSIMSLVDKYGTNPFVEGSDSHSKFKEETRKEIELEVKKQFDSNLDCFNKLSPSEVINCLPESTIVLKKVNGLHFQMSQADLMNFSSKMFQVVHKN